MKGVNDSGLACTCNQIYDNIEENVIIWMEKQTEGK